MYCTTIKGLSNETVGSSSIFSGEEEVFAFARACSRLVEMGSKQWAETAAPPRDLEQEALY